MNLNIESILSILETDLLTYISAGLMIMIDLLILAIGVIYLVFGFIFGTRKSLRRALSFIIPFIIFLCSIDLITKLIANGDISLFVSFFEPVEGTITLKQLGTQFLAEYLYNGNLEVADSSKILEFAEAIFTTTLRMAIYIAGLLVITFGVAPFIRFITWLTYRVQIKGQPKRKMRWSSRVAGMGIASLRYILLLFIFIIPMYGMVSTTHMLFHDAVTILENIDDEKILVEGEYDTIVGGLKKIDKGMNYSLFRAISNATRVDDGASFDMLMLGQLSKVTTSDASVNLLEEYGRYRKIIPVASKFIDPALSMMESKTADPSVFINLVTSDDVNTLKGIMQDSEMIDLILPVGYDYLCFYLSSEINLEEFHLNEEILRSIDINKDFDLIIDASSIALSTIANEDIQFEKPEDLVDALILNESISGNLQVFITDITQTSVVKNIGLPLASIYICDAIDSANNEELLPLKDLVTPEKLELYINNDIKSVFEIVQTLYDTELKMIVHDAMNGLDPSASYIDFTDEKILRAVKTSITKLMALNAIHGNENTVIKALFSLMDTENFDIDEILFDESGNPRINWDNETEVVGDLVVTMLETFGNDIFVNMENPEELIIVLLESGNLPHIISKASDSEVAKALIVTLLYDALASSESIPDNLKAILTQEALLKCFENDLHALACKLQELYAYPNKDAINDAIRTGEFNIDDFDLYKAENRINDLFNTILNLELIKGNEEVLLEYAFSLISESGEIKLDPNNILYDEFGNKVIDWNNEKAYLSESLAMVLGILSGNFTTALKTSGYVELFVYNIDTETIIRNISKSKLIENVVVELSYSLIESEKEIPANLKEILTKDAIRDFFHNDINTLYEEITKLYESPLKDVITKLLDEGKFEFTDINFSDKETKETFESAFITLLTLSIVKGNEEKLLESVITMINDSGNLKLDASSILYDEDGNKYLDWSKEVSLTASILFDLLGVLSESFGKQLDTIGYIEILVKNPNTENVLTEITKSTLLKNVVVNLLAYPGGSFTPPHDALKVILSKEKLEKCFESDLIVLYNLLEDIYNSELRYELLELITEGKFDINNLTMPEYQTIFKDVILRLLNLSLIKGDEELIISMLLENIEGLDIDLDTILYDENGNKYIVWEEETKAIVDALFEVINIFGTDFGSFTFEMLEEKLLNDEERTKQFVDKVSESVVVRKIVLVYLPKVINESNMLPEEMLAFFSEDKFEALDSKEAFKTEINLLLSVVKDLLSLGITDFSSFEITSENQAMLKETLTKLIDSSFIKGNEEELFKLFIDTTNFSSILESNGITLNYEGVTDWHKELVTSIDIAMSFLEISTSDDFALEDLFKGNMTDEEIENVVVLFDHIGESELFKPIVYDLIGNIGYDIEITDSDKALIEENGFGNEINTLLDTLGSAQELLEAQDLSALKGSDVEALMLTASDGIITSKVVGTLLEEALGPNGLNINPVDASGNPKYDFTDPNVLKEQATNIGNLVDLANSVNNFDIENATSVTDITQAIKNLESNELAEDVVKELTGVEVNLEDMNVEEEADLIEDVYNEYANASDKENFEIDEDLATRIEESSLAGTILGMLGIIK